MTNHKQTFPAPYPSDERYKQSLAEALSEVDELEIEKFNQPSIVVPARPNGYWTNSGIFKPKGVALAVIYISGVWKSNKQWPNAVDAGGSPIYTSAPPSYLSPGNPEGCLVAKVGGNKLGEGSYVIAVGRYGLIPPDLEGLIWLTVNDEISGFGDNTGEVGVTANFV